MQYTFLFSLQIKGNITKKTFLWWSDNEFKSFFINPYEISVQIRESGSENVPKVSLV